MIIPMVLCYDPTGCPFRRGLSSRLWKVNLACLCLQRVHTTRVVFRYGAMSPPTDFLVENLFWKVNEQYR